MNARIRILTLFLSTLGFGLGAFTAPGHARADEGSAPAARRVGAHMAPAKLDTADKADKADTLSSKKHPALHGLVNLNQADDITLELLPGIGPKKAERIIEYRHKRPFKKVEDLTKVKGFGRKTLAKLKPYLSIAGASTLGMDDGAAE